ncbi:MAG: FliG C-terminal domain-containing protein [Paracoccus sp. (in: a-proteobacteria)]
MLEPDLLTSRQKAAVIVRVLLGDGGQLSLEHLSPAAQSALAHEMAMMGMVDKTTRDQIVEEFCDSLETVGLTFPDNLNDTLDILNNTLSQDTTDRLRRMAAMTGHTDPWDRIAAMPAQQLADMARFEATEVSAVMFSRLPVPKAAEAFGLMPTEMARQIAYAMSLTGNVTPPALHRIGVALLQASEGLSLPALDGAPVKKVGAILNFVPSGMRDTVLMGLDEDDTAFAAGVRKSIFTWANIPKRIDPRDIPRIIRETDEQILVRAMADPRPENQAVTEFILTSLSARMSDSLREETEALERVTEKESEDAMSEVIATIRRMEGAGDLFLIVNEDDDAGSVSDDAAAA